MDMLSPETIPAAATMAPRIDEFVPSGGEAALAPFLSAALAELLARVTAARLVS